MAATMPSRNNNQTKDHWTAEAYSTSASFVPALASTILSWLAPERSDTILDVGCGDGILTAQIASHCTKVVGLDSSPNLIRAAEDAYTKGENKLPNLKFQVQDCRKLEALLDEGVLQPESISKIFSNAALHWILPHRDSEACLSIFRGAYRALRTNGTLVFEMGGHGNVAELHAAILSAVIHRGASPAAARAASPWFFPSKDLMVQMLESVGFKVERAETEYRPTKCTEEKDGGVEGWVRLMGAQILEVLDKDEDRETAVQEVCDVLETICGIEGGYWMGYVRLRVLARRT